MKNELSDDMKEEMKRLKEELAELKEQLESMSQKREEENAHERGHIHIDIGTHIPQYVADMMEDVA